MARKVPPHGPAERERRLGPTAAAMGLLKDRRAIAVGGAALALAAGLLLAWFVLKRSHAPSEPPPASQAGLVVVSGRDDDAKLDPKRPLRCFVGGRFVGELPLADCAQRNGVATGALDVGLDQAGALAATNGASNAITPLAADEPPPAPVVTQPPPQQGEPAPAASPTGPVAAGAAACWRWGPMGWRELQPSLALPVCVQTLFEGRCPGPEQIFYGRWGDQTLRLTGGRVEISSDNRAFSSFIDPWPPCASAPG